MRGALVTEERHPNNLVAMLLAVIPGLSQVYLEHVLLGAVFFSAFLTALNCLFLAGNLESATNTHLLGRVSLLSLVVIWLGSAWHAYALSYGTDRSGLARDRGDLLRGALLDYLRNDLEPAAVKLERAIELDVDWQDPDPLFHLGVVLLRLAEVRALDQDSDGSRVARRRSQWAFRTCLGRDRFGKWRREIRRETTRMRTLLRSTGRGTSERLHPTDTTIAAFPELGESAALSRPALGPDSSRYARITPRPFNRKALEARLEASDLEQDTVAALPPASLEEDTAELPIGNAGDETVVIVPSEEAEDAGAGVGQSADGVQGSGAAGRRSSHKRSVTKETKAAPPTDETRRSSGAKASGSGESGSERHGESEASGDLDAGDSASGVDLEATHPAQRLLPGEVDGVPDSAAGAGDEELGAEGGMPATRLDVRPQDIIGDLLPRTRQASREERPKAVTPYPKTRVANRPSLDAAIAKGDEKDEGGEREAGEKSPTTRHVSRSALGALGGSKRSRRPGAEPAGADSGSGSRSAPADTGDAEARELSAKEKGSAETREAERPELPVDSGESASGESASGESASGESASGESSAADGGSAAGEAVPERARVSGDEGRAAAPLGISLRDEAGSEQLAESREDPSREDPSHEDPAHEDPAHEDPAHEDPALEAKEAAAPGQARTMRRSDLGETRVGGAGSDEGESLEPVADASSSKEEQGGPEVSAREGEGQAEEGEAEVAGPKTGPLERGIPPTKVHSRSDGLLAAPGMEQRVPGAPGPGESGSGESGSGESGSGESGSGESGSGESGAQAVSVVPHADAEGGLQEPSLASEAADLEGEDRAESGGEGSVAEAGIPPTRLLSRSNAVAPPEGMEGILPAPSPPSADADETDED